MYELKNGMVVGFAGLLAACGAVSACGSTKPDGTAGTPAPLPAVVDGTRLVARMYSFPGTAPLFAGIHDLQKNEACAFARAGDGQIRCLPADAKKATTAVPEEWVVGTEQADEQATGRLRSHWIVSADGGRFPNRLTGELYDTQAHRPRPCRPTTRPAGQPAETRCLSQHVLASGVDFADAACTMPLAENFAQAPSPAFVLMVKDGALHEVGPTWTGQAFSSLLPGGCGANGGVSSAFLSVGPPLAAGVVPNVDVVPRGAGRLALHTLESEGHALAAARFTDAGDQWYDLPAGPYLDNTLGIACKPVWTTAGEARCLPVDAEYTGDQFLAYADPDCTKPVLNTSRSLAVVQTYDQSFNVLATEVRRLDPEFTDTAYEIRAGLCFENRRLVGHRLREAVSLSTYARLDAWR
jgi:hypothetical protein